MQMKLNNSTVYGRTKTKGNTEDILVKIKQGLIAAIFIVLIGIAGTMDLEAQTTYVVKGTAIDNHHIVSGFEQRKTYSNEPLEKGNKYKLTINEETNEVIRIKPSR